MFTSELGDRIVELLARSGQLSVTEISEALGYSKSTISEVISRLEREEYVRKMRRGALTLVGLGRKVITIGTILASEYVLAMPLIDRLEERGLKVFVQVYRNGLELAESLLRGGVHMAYLPTPIAYVLHLLHPEVQPLGSGIGGGSYVLRSPEVRGDGIGRVATTRLSSMELCLSHVRELQDCEVVYASSGSEIVEMLLKGDVEYGVLWEPYATIAVRRGCRVYTSCHDVGIDLCCLPVVNVSTLYLDVLHVVHDEHLRAISELRESDAHKFVQRYSVITGLSPELVEKTMRSYSIYSDDVNKFVRKVVDALPEMPSVKRGFDVIA